MIQAIASVLGYIIRFFYDLVGQNYFITILLFTLFTKVVLFPLAWIQIKSMEKMNKMSVKQKEIQDKYKNDKEKQTQELMNLYKENKVNPLSGCLPLIIQIPIILAMFYIVKQPLTYIVQTPQEEIKTYTQQLLNKEDVNEKEMQANELLIAKEHNLINMQVIPGINLGDDIDTILLILLAIVLKDAVALVLTPLSVIALATALFPLLTDVFSSLIAV